MKKFGIIVGIVLSIFLMSCSQKNTDIQIEVVNNSDTIIQGNFYESNVKIGKSVNLKPLEKHKVSFTKKELVESFDTNGFDTGNLILILNKPDRTEIILTGYITHSYNDLSGILTTISIDKDFNYDIISENL
jgi:hypothetical protein